MGSIKEKLILIFFLGAFLFVLSFSEVSADNSDYKIVKSHDLVACEPEGLAWDGQYLWVGDRNDGEIHKVDPADGWRVKSFDAPGVLNEVIAGLAWDGQYLWDADWQFENIYKIDPSDGSVVKSLNPPDSIPGGLAWDSEYLWNVGFSSKNIYKIDPADGAVVKSFDSPGTHPEGLAWDGQYLLHTDKDSNRIYKIDPSDGEVVSSSWVPVSDPMGLAWDGQFIWVSSDYSEGFYKITSTVYKISTSSNPSSGGSVSLEPSGGSYGKSTLVTVTAIPDSNYEFDYWSGYLSGESLKDEVKVVSDLELTANFIYIPEKEAKDKISQAEEANGLLKAIGSLVFGSSEVLEKAKAACENKDFKRAKTLAQEAERRNTTYPLTLLIIILFSVGLVLYVYNRRKKRIERRKKKIRSELNRIRTELNIEEEKPVIKESYRAIQEAFENENYADAERKLDDFWSAKGYEKFEERYLKPEKVKEIKSTRIGLKNNFRDYSPYEFEKFIAELFERIGYETEVTSKSRDFGLDVIAKKADKTLGIQAKRYKENNTVGAQDIQNTLGSRYKAGADQTILVTTSKFTVAAEEQARGAPIELWDKEKLHEMVKAYFIEV